MSSGEEGEIEFGADGEEEEEEEEDVPLSSLRTRESTDSRSSRKRKAVNYADDDDAAVEEEEEEEAGDADDGDDDEESSDDDDVPLASLKTKPSSNASSPKPKKAAKKKVSKTPTKPSVSTISSISSNKDYASASAALYESDCKKGQLVQKLLCRWWYAVTWPDPAALPDKPPKRYDVLQGFQGVYVCTSGDDVGKILDMRDKTDRPSFQNYAKKPASELQELLITALENQKKELIKAEGSGTETEIALDAELKKIKKMNPATADKEADKVLKAARMTVG